MEWITKPWPWYIGGPLIGLMIPLLLILGNKAFGISSSFRHLCTACLKPKANFFQYDWKKEAWNLYFVVGLLVGGILTAMFMQNTDNVNISTKTIEDLKALGFSNFKGLAPDLIFGMESAFQPKNLMILIVGGFMVGFGTRYAGGCTSGHAIMGMSNLQLPSLWATMSFFAGGLTMTHILFPIIF